jgi:hypothetical protein
VNEKFAWFVIDFISVQLDFNNWYPFLTQFAPSPFAKNISEEVKSALKKNQMILINFCICLDNNAFFCLSNKVLRGGQSQPSSSSSQWWLPSRISLRRGFFCLGKIIKQTR